DDVRMEGEVVLITGGSSGIGLATAQRFQNQGARVWITARNEEKLARAADTLGGSIRFQPSDVADPASLTELAEHLRKDEGRLDVVISSAGQLDLGPCADAAD